MIAIVTAPELEEALSQVLAGMQRVTVNNMPTLASRVAHQFGFHDFPRDARPLLQELGILVDRTNPRLGLDAWWERDADRYRIHLQPMLAGSEEMNLILWHEFFEIVYTQESFPSRYPASVQERLADAFALHLLMPAPEVRQQCKLLNHPEIDRTGTLKARFGVPYGAMKKRLLMLGLAPRRY